MVSRIERPGARKMESHIRHLPKLAILLVSVLIFPAECFAAHRISIEEFNRTLSSARSGNVSDIDLARQIASIELTERPSPAVVQNWIANSLGPKSTEAIKAVANLAAFLNPSATEIPVRPVPDIAAQRKMMALAIDYVASTLNHLPDFIADRVTTSYDNSPQVFKSGDLPVRIGLHAIGQAKTEIAFRTGRETDDPEAMKKKPETPGLTSWGEFGPVLSIVMMDAAKGRIGWSHWEQQTGSSPSAVFQFSVAREQSHYVVNYCCTVILGEPLRKNMRRSPTEIRFNQPVGFHGTLALDPTTGVITRLVIESDFGSGDPLRRADMLVEYGSVRIGEKEFTCPIRSISIAVTPDNASAAEGGWEGVSPGSAPTQGQATKLLLNEVRFENYHHFESSQRILAVEELSPSNSPEPGVPIQSNETLKAATRSEPSEGAHALSERDPRPSQNPSAAADATTAVLSTTAPAENSASIIANDAAPPATAIAESTTPDIPQAPLLKTTTREVVVDVVVTKPNGDLVTGLSKQDFTAQENGKLQTIDFFEGHKAGTRANNVPPVMPIMPSGMRTNVPPAPESDAVNVLLLDTLNTEQQDQAYVRNEVTNFLVHMQPGTRVAIFMLGSKLRFVQGFTTDTSLLLAALRDKRNAPEKSHAFQSRSDVAGDQTEVETLKTMQASPYAIETIQAAQADVAAFSYGTRASMTFEALDYLAQYLAGVPGRKNLLWFAESFPVILFPTAAQRDQISHNRVTSGYLEEARKTENLFTLSRVAVYPIQAQGMMTEHVMDADVAGPSSARGASGASDSVNPYMAEATGRSNTIHSMEQLADSTGGKAFYNSNDLNGAMLRAVNDGANYYTLSYSPTNKKDDGSYRQIEVRLPAGKYKLSYRRGYNADSAPEVDAKQGKNPLDQLLSFGLPSASGVLYGVQVKVADQPDSSTGHAGENTSLKGSLTRYSLDFIIRADDLRWSIAPQGKRSGKILIGLKAFDRDGSAVNWEGSMETMEVGADEYSTLQERGISSHLKIDLPSNGNFRLVTAVYDWNSGMAGTLELPVGPDVENAPESLD